MGEGGGGVQGYVDHTPLIHTPQLTQPHHTLPLSRTYTHPPTCAHTRKARGRGRGRRGRCWRHRRSKQELITLLRLQEGGFWYCHVWIHFARRGVLNIVHGTHDTVNRICDHPDIKAISFVGSNAAGKYIYERGSQNGKRVQASHHLTVPGSNPGTVVALSEARIFHPMSA
jgi:hypothetical protein